MPVARVLAEMESAGIAVDAGALAALSSEFGIELARLERECFEIAGHPFNLSSPIQLRDLLFTELKLSTKGLKKTKSGFSTDADTLEKLAEVHPLPRKLLEYRGLAKLKSTYSDSLPLLMDPADGRIHTRYHQAAPATGRISSTDPNLQNIPTRSEAGRRIRRAFVPRPGCVLLSADYSQIELRVLAHLSADPTLTEAFTHGEDIHSRTASEVLGLARDKIDAEGRRLAKVINFGIIYGMGPQRLAGELGIRVRRGCRVHQALLRAPAGGARVARSYAGRGPRMRLRHDDVRPAPIFAGIARRTGGCPCPGRANSDQHPHSRQCCRSDKVRYGPAAFDDY